MDFDLYKRIIDSCPSSKEVHPQGLGEPLLYPHFIKAIAYAKRKGKTVVLYTNASLLDSDMAEQMLDVGVNEIRFSVEGHDRETYESSRPGLSWNTVLANIENFQRLKNRGGYPTRTTIRMCETEENKPRIKEIINFWRKRVDWAFIIPELYIPPPTELDGRKRASGRHINCDKPFAHLSVLSDGSLVLCCRDSYGSYKMADLNKADVLKAFNNEAFTKVRDAVREGRGYPMICHTCGQPVKKGTKFER